jgi:hypothetical protein
MANLTRETYARIAEALTVDKQNSPLWDCSDFQPEYTGPVSPREFWCAVEPSVREWLQDDGNCLKYLYRLKNAYYGSRNEHTQWALDWEFWRERTCTPLQRIEALAAALGVECEYEESDNG